jgi:hypothetical protein
MSLNSDKLGTALVAAISGLKNDLPKHVKSVKLGEAVTSVPRLVTILEAYAAIWNDAKNRGEAFHSAVEARDKKASELRELLDDFKVAMKYVLGKRNPVLKKFGIPPKKDARKLTTEERAASNEKARETRKARHATGGQVKPAA